MGRGGRGSGSRQDAFDVDYTYELFPLDENGNERTPTVGNTNGITTYTFSDAVENFQGRFGSSEFNSIINITDTFANSTEPIILDAPVNLDLTARYLRAGTTLTRIDGGNVLQVDNDFDVTDPNLVSPEILDEDRIELTFISDELRDKGVYEVTLIVEDNDETKSGFQVGDKTIDSNNPTEDLNDLESIVDILSDSNTKSARISAISSQDPSQIVSISSSSSSPITIEAEEIDPNGDPDGTINITGYRKEDFAQFDGSGLRLADIGQSGEISFQAGDYGLQGLKNLRIDSFDENDGVGSIQVQVKDNLGNTKLDQTINLSETTSSSLPNNDTARSYFIGELPLLNDSDTITITGVGNDSVPNDGNNRGGEFARIDSLTFETDPFFSSIFSRPSLSRTPVVIEAEQIDPSKIENYQQENFTQAGGSGLRLSNILTNTGEKEPGKISFQAQDYGLEGDYDLRINSFDENDGVGTIQVQVQDSSGTLEDTITLDENTNSPLPTDDTRRSYFIGQRENSGIDLDLDGSETITIIGTGDDSQPNDGNNRGGEFARIDNLIFNPVRESFVIEGGNIDPNDNPNDDTIDITGYQFDGSDLNIVGGTQGTISFQAQDYQDYDLAGEYNLRINSYDDATGNIQVQVKNSSGNIELDQTITLNGITDDISSRSYVIGGLDLDATDTISIIGNADPTNGGSRFATINSFEFEPI